MNQELKKIVCAQFILISMMFVLLSFNNLSFAQDKQDEGSAFEEAESEEAPQEEPEEEVKEVKHSAAYKVLGRELTQKEKDLYEGLSEEDIKSELLHKEQRLVLVRALLAVGEPHIAQKVLEVWPTSKLQTFTELVKRFTELKEKYGSVISGVESELVFNIKDDEQAFMKATKKAYETVFCVQPEEQDTAQVVNFLKESKALTYSQMVKKLMDTLTPDDKKDMLFRTLDKVGRPDLKSNKVFVEKMLAQQFNCENLTRLLQEIAPAKKINKK